MLNKEISKRMKDFDHLTLLELMSIYNPKDCFSASKDNFEEKFLALHNFAAEWTAEEAACLSLCFAAMTVSACVHGPDLDPAVN